MWRVEQLLIVYGDTVATYVSRRAGLLSHAKPIQARRNGDSAQMPTTDSREDPWAPFDCKVQPGIIRQVRMVSSAERQAQTRSDRFHVGRVGSVG